MWRYICEYVYEYGCCEIIYFDNSMCAVIWSDVDAFKKDFVRDKMYNYI